MKHHPYDPEKGQTDLMGAAYGGDLEEVVLLSLPSDIDAQDDHRFTALMYAALKGHTEVVQELIAHKASLETQSNQRFTALMYAVRGGHLETAKSLLRAGANPNVHKDCEVFDTPLILAAWIGSLPIVRALVGYNANVGHRGGSSVMPAEFYARNYGHHDVSEFLLYHEKKPLV